MGCIMAEIWKRGTFSKVYRLADGTVKVVSTDPVKECMVVFGFGNSGLWPSIERIDTLNNGTNVFIMPLYEQPKSLKNALMPDQYALYRAIKASSENRFMGKNQYDAPMHWRKVFREGLGSFPAAAEALCDAVDSLQNYGYDIRFEISQRNVAVKDGNLILLDCFFFLSALESIYKKRSG